jgi:hypothetical protein
MTDKVATIMKYNGRFEINMPYSSQCIEHFRTIKKRSYCKASKTWSFDSCDYDKIISFMTQNGFAIQHGHIKKPVDLIINDDECKVVFKSYIDRFDMFRIHPYHYSREERSCTYPIDKLEEIKKKLEAINCEVTTTENRKLNNNANQIVSSQIVHKTDDCGNTEIGPRYSPSIPSIEKDFPDCQPFTPIMSNNQRMDFEKLAQARKKPPARKLKL